jgi:hypothetical protein
MKLGMKAVLVVACLGLAACTSDLESSDPTPAPAPAVEPSRAGQPGASADSAQRGAPVVALDARARARARSAADVLAIGAERDEPGSPFVCRKNAFCEDFEEQGWTTRWNDVVTSSGGKIELGQESASSGRGALRMFTDGASSSAYLLQEPGDVAGDWSGLLSFAFRAEQLPGKYLGGPELTVKTADGPITIRVALKPEGLVLEQLADATCRRDRCEPTSKVIAAAEENHWYRVRLGFEVNPRAAGPYGRIEISVDGGGLQSTDLTVPMFDGSMAMRAGITQGDARRGFADLDDLTMLIRH